MKSWLSGALALLLACATPTTGEKGRLVSTPVTSAELDRAHEGGKYALVIGIGAFRDPAWRQLRYAEKDARDVAAALRDPARGAFDEVELLTGAAQTTRAQILAALERLAARAKRPHDVALVYVSSHGTLARDARGELVRYLVTHEASMRNVSESALAMDALQGALERMGSRRRVLVIASCHSGTGKSLLPPELAREVEGIKSGFYPRPLEDSSRVSLVLSASDWGEAAREDEALENDIYTHFLLQSLDGRGDRNFDGAVSATEAHDYARRLTFAFTGGTQRPSAQILEVGADPVILAGSIRSVGAPELFSYSPRLDGFSVAIDGKPVGELPGGLSVAAGRRSVRLTKGGEVLLQRELELRPGERVALEGLLAPKHRPRQVSLVAGGLGFIDSQSRAEVMPEGVAAGVALRLDDLLFPGIALEADVLATAGAASLRLDEVRVPVSFQALSAGVATPARWNLGVGFSFSTGPRLALLWARRSFSLPTYSATQDVLTVIPGWTAGGELRLSDRLALTLGLDLSVAVITVDQVAQPRALGGARLGMGYRF